jgi:hypothetical protein
MRALNLSILLASASFIIIGLLSSRITRGLCRRFCFRQWPAQSPAARRRGPWAVSNAVNGVPARLSEPGVMHGLLGVR